MLLKQIKKNSKPPKNNKDTIYEQYFCIRKVLSLKQYWREELHTALQAVPRFHRCHVDQRGGSGTSVTWCLIILCLSPGSSPNLLTAPSANIQSQLMSTTFCCISYNILRSHISDCQKLMMDSELTSARNVPLYNYQHSTALGSSQCSGFCMLLASTTC